MIVSLLGLVISLFAYLIAFPAHRRRFDIYGALLAVHVIACVAYWLLSFESAMDAFLYYRDPYNFYAENPMAEGTYFIVWLVQTIRKYLGGSFLDHFLFFQCFGMIGLAFICRSFIEVAESFGEKLPLPLYGLLFLPGLNFWSAGIGKDGPMIMACALAVWASIKLQQRLLWLAVALAVMVCIRPHLAAITLVGVCAGLMLSKRFSKRAKVALAPVAAAGLAVVVYKAQQRFNVTLDTASISDFVQNQQNLGVEYGSGAALQSLPLPLKIFSLLFRPLFIGAQGMMEYAASFENALLLYICSYIVFHWKLLLSLFRNVFYLVYCVISSALLVVLLSLVNYNLGLGQRQKMMAMPAILLIYVSLFLYKRYLAALNAHSTADLPAEIGDVAGVPAQA